MLARMLVTSSNRLAFGATEFLVRDRLLQLGARIFDAALHERTSACSSAAARRGASRGDDRLPALRSRRRVRPLPSWPRNDAAGQRRE